MTTVTFTSSGTWTAPTAVVTTDAQCWAEGGNGGTGTTGTGSHSGGGGGGGEYAEETTLAVTAGNVYTFTIGSGGSSTNTTFPGDSVTVTAHHGGNATGASAGTAGSGSTNSIHHNGGAGGAGITVSNPGGGGGGGGAGSTGTGGGGGIGVANGFGAGGSAGTPDGGAGGDGGRGNVTFSAGVSGSAPGGAGGGGSGRSGGTSGGSGAGGQITLTYSSVQSGTAVLAGVGTLTAQGGPAGIATLAGVGTLQANRAGAGNAVLAGVGTLGATAIQGGTASLSGVGTLSAVGGLPAPAVVNQWANNYGQGTAFGSVTSSLQSCVVPLTPAFSVGGGSGVASPGNWLFAIASWTQDPAIINTHVGVSDDIHSWWRQYPASGPGGNVRTSIGYTPNTAREVGYVYCAPDGAVAAINVLVVEVSGLGPWDTVASGGPATGYTPGGTSVSLSLSAPGQPSFFIGGVGGDNTSSGQAFLPSGYSALATQTQSNGVDHTADNILTSAYRASSSLSQSVSGTSSSSEDLSGFLLGVYVSGQDPIPAGQNPNWPYTKFEVAFGAGFNTPNSELTWTDLTTRLWSWDETTGIQYQLGQIQSTNLDIELDNFDGLLTPGNPAAYFYTTGGWQPSSAQYDTLVGAQDPLAWWVLGDPSGSGSAADSSGNGHPATATSVTFGNTSQAVSGDNTASFASASTSHCLSSYNPSFTAVTVEAWVNLNGLSQGGNNPRLVANGHTDSDNKGFQLMINNSRQPQFWVGNGTSNGNAAGGTVPTSGWTYLAGTYDGATVSLYVNGVLQTASPFTGTVTAGLASGIGLGYNPTYSGDYLNGLLAEAAVYGQALTASQIAAHYTAGPGADGTPIRLRMALGTMAGVNINRWYVLQRNMHELSGEINANWRRWAPVSGTDLWSAMSSVPPTFYRAEIYEDNPYAWWPMDDQPLESGVLPVTLLNAATGNTNALNIQASPAGVTAQDTYGFNGVDITAKVISSGHYGSGAVTPPTGSIATYAVGTNSGWMYGDPPSATSSISAAGNPVEASPGSASWQQAGFLGPNGSNGWYLICNDTSFPGLSSGITLKGWFNVGLAGAGAGYVYYNISGSNFTNTSLAGQPFTSITICEIATASNPVAVLQLDSSGHLNLITYNGGTGTSHSIYSASDLRNGTWTAVDMTLTASTWTVMLNGGMTATVSGSGAGMTSAWTYLILCGDFGSSGGTGASNLVHGGNMSLAHWAVFPYILPAWRILAHYTAATTGFGLLPAPVATQISPVSGPPYNVVNTLSINDGPQDDSSYQTTPDGLYYTGSYGKSGNSPASYSYSLVATANAGSYNSGPSARAVTAGIGQVLADGNSGPTPSYNTFGYALWLSWTGVAPQFTVYSAAAATAEKALETILADGTSVTSGYGSGASPPAAATPLGDTVAQRIERLMRAGRTTCPQRSIDPASDLVQAPGSSGGGQQTGSSIQAIQQSDGGFLAVDNVGNLFYWSRDHLASQYNNPVWTVGPDTNLGQIPYYPEYRLVNDPQRIYNVITVQPFSPSGAQLPLLTPQNAAGVLASQNTHGAQPLAITSLLQNQTLMQQQANFLFTNFGQPQTRAENVRIDAAPSAASWQLVAGINVGDLVTLEVWQVGGGGEQLTLRATQVNRKIRFGGQDEQNSGAGTVVASVELILDAEPSSYWGD